MGIARSTLDEKALPLAISALPNLKKSIVIVKMNAGLNCENVKKATINLLGLDI